MLMRDKVTTVRWRLMDMIESGELKPSQRLDGVRSLARELGVSLVIVQQAVSSLAKEGVLRTVPRSGTYVADGTFKIPQSSIVRTVFKDYLFFNGLRGILDRRIPRLRLAGDMFGGVFEVNVTLTLQAKQSEYMDLSALFDEAYPDKSVFFDRPFVNFRSGGKLFGVPFIFSPRLMFYNPSLLKKAGCKSPANGWSWEDFIDCVRRLKRVLPAERVFNWVTATNMWMNFVFRSGGCLFTADGADPVRVDDPKTRHGLALFLALKRELGIDNSLNAGRYILDFAKGRNALLLAPREALPHFEEAGFDNWKTVPLPVIEGGSDLTTQATDVLCVRNSCADLGLAAAFIRVMLSEEVQDFIGASRYGIPIRKSSAMKSIDFDNPSDTLFLNEMSKMSAEYNINSPELESVITCGIGNALATDGDIDEVTGKLAGALRVFNTYGGRRFFNCI